MSFPFIESEVKHNVVIREFKQDVPKEELVWHQDREDRHVKVIESDNWLLQMDNKLPIVLREGRTYRIPAYVYHRVIKGNGKLIIEITKYGKK